MFRLIVFLLFMPSFLQAQNLVPNGDFEDTISCPAFVSDFDVLQHWFSAGESPDCFNVCAPISGYANAPNTGLGYQIPLTGVGYGGFGTISTNSALTSYREYIGIRLTQDLTPGLMYHLSFYVSAGFGGPVGIYTFSNNIGAYFSSLKFERNNNPLNLNNSPHMNYDTIVNDTASWQRINLSFVADSAYRYLYIGNFYDNNNTDSIHATNTTGGIGAYYFIENVCLSTSANNCPLVSIEDILSSNILDIFPNPFNEGFTISLKIEPLWIKLFLVDGKEIPFEMERNEDAYVIKPLSLNHPSLIFVRVLSKDGVYSSGKVLYQP